MLEVKDITDYEYKLASWTWQLSSGRVEFSENWNTMVGYSDDYLAGSIDDLVNIVYEPDRDILLDKLELLKQDKKKREEYTLRILTKSGKLKWIKLIITLIKSDYNDTRIITGLQEDINEFKVVETLLKDSNLRFKKLVENFSGGILLEDDDRKVFYANQDFCQLFNINCAAYEFIGQSHIEMVEKNKVNFLDKERLIETTTQYPERQQTVRGEEFELTDGRILERDYIPISDQGYLNGHIWVYRDITKFKRNEEKLKFRLDFERIILQLSTKFINMDWREIDDGINDALSIIGKFLGADRSYVFLFSEDKSIMDNTHEWVSEGIIPEMENLQDIPTNVFPWWMDQINNRQTINFASLDEMPVEAAAEKAILEPQNIKSLIVVPIINRLNVIGYAGFDSVVNYRDWTEDSVKLLSVASDVISNALTRKTYEEAIIKSETQYKLVVNSVKEVIFQTDADGNWVFLNPAWTEITGFDQSESLNRNFLDFVHPEDRERNQKRFEPLINRAKEYCRHEIRYITKSGGFKWIEVYARLVIDEEDNIAGTTGTLKDITERKKSEEEIRKLSRAVETTPSAILLTNLEGEIIYTNPGLITMCGFRESTELAGRKIFELTDKKGNQKLISEIIPALFNGEKWSGEINMQKYNGELLPTEMICSVVFDENEKPQYLLANFYDISHRKEAEENVRKSLEKERELNELKSKFISMVSHEFRTPLTAILSSSELLELYLDKWSEEERNKLIYKIKTSVKNLIDILSDLTEINRIETGKVKIKSEEVRLNSFIAELIDEVITGSKLVPEILFTKLASELTATIDKNLLRQIAINIISNAVKYTPQDKKVCISLEHNSGYFTLSVKDEGIGIPEKDQKNLFEPFMRADNAVKFKGTGLGLSIMHRAVNCLNGRIWFKSEENIGSEFRISLPLKTSVL